MANTLQIKRGIKSNMPTLNQGELFFATDEDASYVGNGATNLRFVMEGDVGTIASQDASSVSITGGTISSVDATNMNVIDFDEELDNGTSSYNTNIDWSLGNNQKITLSADITLSFTNMGIGHKQLKIVQDATGYPRTPTLPSGKWPGGTTGTFSTDANAIDILSIYYDGTNYYFQVVKGWA